jgi:ketosteroid isomerase-like protein
MSLENVEIVRGLYEALARRDGVAPFELYAEDIVWDVSQSRAAFLYTQPVSRGHDGVRQGWREWLSAFSEIDAEVAELIDAGDQVVAVIRERELGRASGVRVEATHAAVWTLAHGKVTRMQVFDDRERALEAAGLKE